MKQPTGRPDYNWEEFQGILKEKKFKAIYKDLYKGKDISLSLMPKGYEKGHPAIDYLKLKRIWQHTQKHREDGRQGRP